MLKSEIISRLARRYPQLLAKDAEDAATTILDAIARSLCSGDRVEIRDFGSFCVIHRSPRVGRNPNTGQKVLVIGKYVPYFRAGKELRNRVCEVRARGKDHSGK